MGTLINGLIALGTEPRMPCGYDFSPTATSRHGSVSPAPRLVDVEILRRCAWEIGEHKVADQYQPASNHVGLGMVTPGAGFAHWNILQDWVDETAQQKGDAWHHCRLVLRLYDVSYIDFNGGNAHRLRDFTLPALSGHIHLSLGASGTWQLAEVGFLLRNGEFVAAARSQAISFARDTVSPRHDPSALLVSPRGEVEKVGNVWEQDKVLRERCRPQLRRPLRIAAFALNAMALGHEGIPARFVSELAAGQRGAGHDVHVFVPADGSFTSDRDVNGVRYHPIDLGLDSNPINTAEAFRQAARDRLNDFPCVDLIHLHEWMTGLAPRIGPQPTVLSLSSIETTRRNGTPANGLSLKIEKVEREAAHAADCVLVPPWLHEQAVTRLDLDKVRVQSFPMEGRLANDWEAPLDYGQVKKEIGLGPFDRYLLFVGSLEHAAGPDLMVEALPSLLHRAQNLRLVFVGFGDMHGSLGHRAHQLGVGGLVRLLGHVEGQPLIRLLRAAEALVLPSRYRVPFDDAVVDLARRAGRPVITTHSGPAHLVKHEENGIVTYDNPGSMVWAGDRILSDPGHADRMGRNGQRREDASLIWGEVARHYLELCTGQFPELCQPQWD
jgi:glycogen(starch) synthase